MNSNKVKVTLREFIDYKLYPSLFDYLPQVFPMMDFKLKKGNWESLYHINGELSKSGDKDAKSVVTRKFPNRIINKDGDYHNGRKSLDLIGLYQYKNNGLPFFDALRQMSDKLGLEFPKFSPDQEQRYQKKRELQDKLFSLSGRMRETLFTHEGKETLAYLTRAKEDGGRGYDSELIKDMGLGCITPDLARELKEATKDGDFNTFPSGVGEIYPLAIVREERGQIVGFNFRRIDGSGKERYMEFNQRGVKSLSGLQYLKLTGNSDKDYELTIVEGELDALHAQAKGFPNVCASGREIEGAEETFARLRRFSGLRRVVILFDGGEDKTEEKIDSAVRVIRRAGLSAYVAKLPTYQDENGKEVKIDLDEYLLTHSVDEALGEIYNSKRSANDYQLNRLFAQQAERFDRERLLDKVSEIYYSAKSALEREGIISTTCDMVQRYNEEAWTKEGLRTELEEYAKRQEEARLRVMVKKELYDLRDDLDKGSKTLDEFARGIEELSRTIKSEKVRTDKEDILRTKTREEVFSMLREVPRGINTKYYFKDLRGTLSYNLTLPQGALTIVGAPTSHGKSTLLRNLALDIAEGLTDDEAILYFIFEEDETAVLAQFLNSYANVVVHQPSHNYPQLDTIKAYLASDMTSPKCMDKTKAKDFKAKVEEYIAKDYINKIKIIGRDYDANSLVDILRDVVSSANIKAVFIDYIQLMRKTGSKVSRAEELKEICISLNTFAKETKLPIVLASQLTRSINSPSGLVNSALSESSDIEKSANTIICLWNGIEKSGVGLSKAEEDDVKKIEGRGAKVLGSCEFGEGGFIYAKLTKNRGGVKNLEAFLPYNGNTGRITN